ncbi:MAG: 16S rRNA (adenine(1518)-N(6)/adenine(1519)-N(6))-dimethyltransferase, partial [Bacteroidia bacterium]|nr:16S rRNA (adenine(1518)-N(6)/adenine(1519)-N(6))-dimethyltransferase [Bacteroidia bacterium]
MVKAKKYLGQHFLKDLGVAQDIVEQLSGWGGYRHVLEIGPGTGILSDFLLLNDQLSTFLIEIDAESVQYLRHKYPNLGEQLIEGDFLKLDLEALLPGQPLGIIGNFPYHISSQIFFKIL